MLLGLHGTHQQLLPWCIGTYGALFIVCVGVTAWSISTEPKSRSFIMTKNLHGLHLKILFGYVEPTAVTVEILLMLSVLTKVNSDTVNMGVPSGHTTGGLQLLWIIIIQLANSKFLAIKTMADKHFQQGAQVRITVN